MSVVAWKHPGCHRKISTSGGGRAAQWSPLFANRREHAFPGSTTAAATHFIVI